MTNRATALALAISAVLVASSIATGARAEADAPDDAREPATRSLAIAVVCADGDRFGLRLVAELEALGFRAIVVHPDTEVASRATLEATARAAGAVAAIRGVASERGVEVWIADRVTGKTVLREMVRDDSSSEPDGALALRAVELLRASLLETSLPSAPKGEVAATPELRTRLALPRIPAREPEAPSTLRLAVAPSLLLTPGGFGPAVSLTIGLAWMPTEHVGAIGFAAIPLSHPVVSATEGSADLSVVLAGGGLRFAFASRASTWTPTGDVGLTVVSLHSTGTAASGFVAKSTSATTAAPFLGVGLALAATRTFRLRADVVGVLVAQSVSIEFASNKVASWGAPVIIPSIGGDFGWF